VIIKQTDEPKLTKLGDNLTVFSASSRSRPGTFHFVVAYPDERGIQCTCEGWRYQAHCWHVEQVPLCLAKQAKTTFGTNNKGHVFNMQAITECYYVEGHQGEHSWET
jgi:hypothetical protein